MATAQRVVYVVGAGLSVGLGFPAINDLLEQIWPRLAEANVADAISEIIRFHHPDFNASIPDTFVNIEELLSEMKANEQLFDSSRPATGNFTTAELRGRRQTLLLQMAAWFHELQAQALTNTPDWLTTLVSQMQSERAQIISFNWDLVLDQLLFGDDLDRRSYGLRPSRRKAQLIKPHGSLNWFAGSFGKHLRTEKKFSLTSRGSPQVFAFKPYRAPTSTRRTYMPLIVPPVYNKEFEGPLFQELWQHAVAALSTASEVRFLGYSLPTSDFHARFILRCGFYNQEHGALCEDGTRSSPTGRARVRIVNPAPEARARIEKMVGWPCDSVPKTVEDWVSTSF
jgi:hypothetical protein